MNRLISISDDLMNRSTGNFTRFLFNKISLSEKISGIVGGRGVGNTTLLLQCMRNKLGSEDKGLYVNLDDFYFSNHSLLGFSKEFYKKGGTHLFIDDLHKLPGAEQDLIFIASELPNLHIVFSSTTLKGNASIDNLRENPGLHFLPGMSFREFLEFRYQFIFPVINFDELLELNRNPGISVLNRIRPLQFFDEYLREGYYPLSGKSTADYQNRLMKILNQILEGDLSAMHHIDYESVGKIRQLLSFLADNGPLKPNIERLAEEIGTTRDSLLKFLKYLQHAGLVVRVDKEGEVLKYLTKPDRLLLNNSNLITAISSGYTPREAILETFLFNQLFYGHRVQLSDNVGFLVDGQYRFEMKWRVKSESRSSQKAEAYSICDGLDYQIGTRIPLWMFGFLY